MGYSYDLMEPVLPRIFRRSVPGPVRCLKAAVSQSGALVLQWTKPAGSAATSYRVERTRDGRNYELLFETVELWCLIEEAPLREPWFYRVTAANTWGVGKANRVWFFQRAANRLSRLLPVPVIPNLRVNICELSEV